MTCNVVVKILYYLLKFRIRVNRTRITLCKLCRNPVRGDTISRLLVERHTSISKLILEEETEAGVGPFAYYGGWSLCHVVQLYSDHGPRAKKQGQAKKCGLHLGAPPVRRRASVSALFSSPRC